MGKKREILCGQPQVWFSLCLNSMLYPVCMPNAKLNQPHRVKHFNMAKDCNINIAIKSSLIFCATSSPAPS